MNQGQQTTAEKVAAQLAAAKQFANDGMVVLPITLLEGFVAEWERGTNADDRMVHFVCCDSCQSQVAQHLAFQRSQRRTRRMPDGQTCGWMEPPTVLERTWDCATGPSFELVESQPLFCPGCGKEVGT